MSTGNFQYGLDFSQRLDAAAQEGMAAADEHADERWKHFFDGCVLAAARKQATLTSDEVLDEMDTLPKPPGTHNLSAIGAAMVRAGKMGILSSTPELRRSTRKGKNGNLHRVWASKVFTEKEN